MQHWHNDEYSKIKLYLYLWKTLLQFDPTTKSSSKEATKYWQECTQHGQKDNSQKEQICTLNGRQGKRRLSINFGKYSNLGNLERKLLKYWQKHAQHRQPHMLEKVNSYLYLWTILFQFNLKIKPSSNEATEVLTRTYTTLTTKEILEREKLYLKND